MLIEVHFGRSIVQHDILKIRHIGIWTFEPVCYVPCNGVSWFKIERDKTRSYHRFFSVSVSSTSCPELEWDHPDGELHWKPRWCRCHCQLEDSEIFVWHLQPLECQKPKWPAWQKVNTKAKGSNTSASSSASFSIFLLHSKILIMFKLLNFWQNLLWLKFHLNQFSCVSFFSFWHQQDSLTFVFTHGFVFFKKQKVKILTKSFSTVQSSRSNCQCKVFRSALSSRSRTLARNSTTATSATAIGAAKRRWNFLGSQAGKVDKKFEAFLVEFRRAGWEIKQDFIFYEIKKQLFIQINFFSCAWTKRTWKCLHGSFFSKKSILQLGLRFVGYKWIPWIKFKRIN